MPRLTGLGAEALNRLADQLDADALEERTLCLASQSGNADYTRFVQAPFTGPRFLSVTINEDSYCGGSHPNVDIRPLTFDRETGGLPDWRSLWPTIQVDSSLEGTGYWPATTRAPALVDWFRAAVRDDPETDAEWLSQCEAHYGPEPIDEALVLWLDAETGGIGMDLAWLAHAEKACGSARVMPIDTAERLGASPELVEALRRGYADRAYRSLPAS